MNYSTRFINALDRIKKLSIHDVAYSASKDAAEAQCRKAGRRKWNQSDYDLACRTYIHVIDKMKYFLEFAR